MGDKDQIEGKLRALGQEREPDPNWQQRVWGRIGGMYILDEDGTPREEADVLVWGKWFEDNAAKRIVAADEIEGGARVSTVFLGLDHDYGDGRPVLWETMIFGGVADGYQDRYTSRDLALIGHGRSLARAAAAPPPIPALFRCRYCWDAAGATEAAWHLLASFDDKAMLRHARTCEHSPLVKAIRGFLAAWEADDPRTDAWDDRTSEAVLELMAAVTL